MKSNKEEIENFILLQRNKNFSEKSILNWESQLNLFEKSLNKNFKDAEESDILKFLNESKSVNSKRFKLNTIRKFYKYLFHLSKHDNLPECLIRIDLPKQKHDDINYRERIISESEYERLILNCANPKERAILETFYNFGVRKSELLSILYKDVKFEDGMTIITVRESKTETRDVIYWGRSKYLLEWIETLFPFKDEPKHYVFFSSIRKSQPYSEYSIKAMVDRITKRANIERRITPHDFRHTCITNHCKNGTPETHIKSIMGLTKDTEVLSVYDHNKSKAYKEYLLDRNKEIKPTYDLIEEQKQTIEEKEEKHEQEINEIKKTLNTFIKLYKSQNEEMDKLYKKEENLEETEDELFKSKTREKIYKEKLNIEEFETLKKLDLI